MLSNTSDMPPQRMLEDSIKMEINLEVTEIWFRRRLLHISRYIKKEVVPRRAGTWMKMMGAIGGEGYFPGYIMIMYGLANVVVIGNIED